MSVGSKVLVTGAGGIIGSHLVETLLQAGHLVRAFVRYNSSGKRGWLDDFQPSDGDLETFFGDITDARAVFEAARGCTRIYHLAALIGIPYSYVAPASYVAVNVTGTLNVLEAARVMRSRSTGRDFNQRSLWNRPVHADYRRAPSPGSIALFGDEGGRRPSGPELSQGFWIAGYRGATIQHLRTSSEYASSDSDDYHPGTFRGHDPDRQPRSCPRHGVCRGYCQGVSCTGGSPQCVGTVTNLATGIGVTVGELIDRIQQLAGKQLPVIEKDERKRPEASEVFKLLGSARLASERAKWNPQTSLADGLAKTIDWFRAHTDGSSARIKEYRV